MPSSTEKKILAQALESEKVQVCAEGALSGEEDVRLVAQIDLREYLQVKYNRPPGVTTMEAWNKTILSDGKHRGNTHDATFNQDLEGCIDSTRVFSGRKWGPIMWGPFR